MLARAASNQTLRFYRAGIIGARWGVSATLACAACSLLYAAPSQAAAPGAGATFDETRVNYQPPKAERRDGFAMGVQSGFGLGVYSGYPLSVAALNDPQQHATTGPAFASNLGLWVGGALRDFLTVGVGLNMLSGRGQQTGVQSAFILHVEAFPLFYMGGLYQDLGIGLDGGIGIGLMGAKDDKKFDDPTAEGGAMSSVSVNVFWEPLRFWHFSAGPSLGYSHGFSQTMLVNQVTLGFRLAVYGVQPKKKTEAQTSASRATLDANEF